MLGHYADANLGDDACPTALLEHISRLAPDAQFVLFCRFPAIAETRYGLPAYPVHRLARGQTGPWEPPAPLLSQSGAAPSGGESRAGWRARARAVPPLRLAVRAARALLDAARTLPAECRFLWESLRRLRPVDLLLVTGSNPLFDYFGGFWGFPYTMWKWSVLARLTGTRIAFVSVGAGPIVSPRSGWLLARVLRRAHYVSFRDEGSRRLMREHGFQGQGLVCPDLAHSLPFRSPPRRIGSRLRVGINPMIVHHRVFWPVSDTGLYHRYIDALATFATGLIRDGHEVFLYGTQKDDRVTAEEIQGVIRAAVPSTAVPQFTLPQTIEELLDLCATADVLVPTRFHGAVFGILTTRPTLAICYQGKTREVLETAGLGEFALDFDEVSPGLLRSAFDRLCDRRHEVEVTLEEHAGVLRARLQEQYDRLVALLGIQLDESPESGASQQTRVVGKVT